MPDVPNNSKQLGTGGMMKCSVLWCWLWFWTAEWHASSRLGINGWLQPYCGLPDFYWHSSPSRQAASVFQVPLMYPWFPYQLGPWRVPVMTLAKRALSSSQHYDAYAHPTHVVWHVWSARASTSMCQFFYLHMCMTYFNGDIGMRQNG